jgi:hypothetical protein
MILQSLIRARNAPETLTRHRGVASAGPGPPVETAAAFGLMLLEELQPVFLLRTVCVCPQFGTSLPKTLVMGPSRTTKARSLWVNHRAVAPMGLPLRKFLHEQNKTTACLKVTPCYSRLGTAALFRRDFGSPTFPLVRGART